MERDQYHGNHITAESPTFKARLRKIKSFPQCGWGPKMNDVANIIAHDLTVTDMKEVEAKLNEACERLGYLDLDSTMSEKGMNPLIASIPNGDRISQIKSAVKAQMKNRN